MTTKKPNPRKRGRPPAGTVRVMLKLRPETNQLLQRTADRMHITKSEFVERAIRLQVANML
jgi:hypothetical protein